MPKRQYDPFDFGAFPAGAHLVQDTLNRLFNEPVAARPWSPPVDILETENELVVKADLPGVTLEDIDIRIEQGTLSLKGERAFEKPGDKSGYHRLERSYGEFSRYFQVPDTVDAEKVRAEYRNGVLTIVLPKKELAKPRSIKVDIKE